LTSLIVFATAVESSTMFKSAQKETTNVPHRPGRVSIARYSYTPSLYTAYSVKIDYTDIANSKRFTTTATIFKKAEVCKNRTSIVSFCTMIPLEAPV
jgi:hypothetical protein